MVASIILAASPVWATFPGENGRIAYRAGANQIFLTDSGQLTFPPPGFLDFDPAFSPDGKQVAFIRQNLAGSGYFYQIMVVGTDGTGLRQVANSTAFDPDGIVPFHSVHSPAWLADGQRISVVVTNLGANNGIWTVGGSAGTVQTVQGDTNYVNWSPMGDEMVYTCTFRSTMSDLCVYNPVTTALLPLPIDWPGRLAIGPGEPKWTPDGEKIVFFLEYVDGKVRRVDIFSVNADAPGLTKITNSGPDLCPDDPAVGAASFFYQSPTPSPDGKALVSVKWENVRGVGPGCRVFNGLGGKWLSVLGPGGPEKLLLADPFGGSGTDWQPLLSNLTLKLDDGHDKPLKGLKVELRKLDGTVVDDHPVNTIEGTYVFEKEIPPADYVVRATLVDHAASPGSVPAFDIRYSPTPSEPVWLEMRITVPAGSVTLSRPFSQDNPDLFDYGPGSSLILRDRLDDMANIYFRTRQFVDWVKTRLTADTGPTVEFYTFATIDPFDGSTVSNDAAYYLRANTAIVFGVAESEFENRDGVSDSAHDNDAPENGEWHEFTHHLFRTFVNSGATCSTNFVNHGGYNNPDTCDSMSEGFATFLAAFAAQEIGGVAEDQYDDFAFFLEENRKAWGYRPMFAPPNSLGNATKEDWAVASLFWDFVDTNADTEDTLVIGADFAHKSVKYTDQVTVPIRQLWNQLTSAHPATVFALRGSFGQPALTRDLDGDGVVDIAPVDEVFLMHGFFPVETDQTINLPHATYHYDVGYAQRLTPANLRNFFVGVTSHSVFNASGAVTTPLIPRFHTPLDPHANLEIHVVNSTGLPLADATLIMTIRTPSLERTVSRRLASGDGALVHLELAPYFDYLLPTGAPLPACDPVHDFHVEVSVSATVNGVSSNTVSFDNCTYLQAIQAATGPAALTFTLTVPTTGGGSPEVCDGIDNDLDGQIDEGLGTLSCGVGACARTIDVCLNGIPQTCMPGTPTAEVCDGSDNNCDGQVDEGLGTLSCGVGACAQTVTACVGGSPQTCTPRTPAPEVCDGLDNDCNGQTDEGLGSLSCGVGACARTVLACVDGVSQVCTPGAPVAEICGDKLDNDCDGGVDNGCPPLPAADACLITTVLDTFNRADGNVGINWRGVTDTSFYRIAGNRLDVQAGGPLYWNPAVFGTSQAAFVRLSTVDVKGPSQGVLLKVQSGSVPNTGAIAVVYDAVAKAVRVSTLRLGALAWTPYGNTAVLFSNGDKLGACAKANGEVHVYKNDVLVKTVTLSAADQGFFNPKGGKVGLWSVFALRTFFDDFGGATITP